MPANKSELRFKRILTLGPSRMSLVSTALAAGERPICLARRIQKEWGLLTDVSTAALAKQLARYRAEIVSALVAKVGPDETRFPPPAFDTYSKLLAAAALQEERLRLAMVEEKRIGFPLPAVTREVELMTDMLVVLAKLEFELGLVEFKGHAHPSHHQR